MRMGIQFAAWLVVASPAFAAVPSFETAVLPIIAARCVHCHGEREPKNGLDLRTREGLIRGGKTGSAMQPGSLRESLIWTFIATNKMPADGRRLTAVEKDTVRRWILAGAPSTDRQAAEVAALERQASRQTSASLLGVVAMADGIDRRISDRLKLSGLEASPPADDAEFLRRAYLDLIGRVPSYDEAVQFLTAGDVHKRSKLIDELLASPEFGQHLAVIWHKLLIPKSAGAYTRIPHDKHRAWLAEQFNSDRGWNELVSDLITAEGYLPSNKDNDITSRKDAKLTPLNVSTSFINVHNTEGRPQPKGIVASVSRLFLAQSIECAECHNHPQAKWQQADFWAAAAFFERIRYERAMYGDTSIGKLMEPAAGPDLVYEDQKAGRYAFVPRIVSQPVIDMQDANGQRTGQFVRARYLDGDEPELDPASSYRAAFAAWATSADNPYFARAMVNRVWSHLLGRGFVEPVDDMSEDNRPSHPEILDELSDEFAASGFKIKHLIRCICSSQTYQRSSAPVAPGLSRESEAEPADPARPGFAAATFARQSLKQLTEDQLLASLKIVAPTFAKVLDEDARDKNPGLFARTFLEVHETGDSLATEHTRGLQQALRMMNGDGKLFNREALRGRVSPGDSIDNNIEALYLQTLCRYPSQQELALMSAYVNEAQQEIGRLDERQLPQRRSDQPDNTPDSYADVFWVLINSGEFIFNH